jgi:hypothetical protein
MRFLLKFLIYRIVGSSFQFTKIPTLKKKIDFEGMYPNIDRNYKERGTKVLIYCGKRFKKTTKNDFYYFAHAHCCSKFIMRHEVAVATVIKHRK